MKQYLNRIICISFMLSFYHFSKGQTRQLGHPEAFNLSVPVNPYANQVILKHYTTQELEWMQANDTLKYKTVCYYYTQSFIVEKINCTNCLTFNPEQFDVWDYERFRKKNQRYSRVWTKYGFKLTLLSVNELQYKLPTQNAMH